MRESSRNFVDKFILSLGCVVGLLTPTFPSQPYRTHIFEALLNGQIFPHQWWMRRQLAAKISKFGKRKRLRWKTYYLMSTMDACSSQIHRVYLALNIHGLNFDWIMRIALLDFQHFLAPQHEERTDSDLLEHITNRVLAASVRSMTGNTSSDIFLTMQELKTCSTWESTGTGWLKSYIFGVSLTSFTSPFLTFRKICTRTSIKFDFYFKQCCFQWSDVILWACSNTSWLNGVPLVVWCSNTSAINFLNYLNPIKYHSVLD